MIVSTLSHRGSPLDLNPLIATANIGYRFNLEDLLGRRGYTERLK